MTKKNNKKANKKREEASPLIDSNKESNDHNSLKDQSTNEKGVNENTPVPKSPSSMSAEEKNAPECPSDNKPVPTSPNPMSAETNDAPEGSSANEPAPQPVTEDENSEASTTNITPIATSSTSPPKAKKRLTLSERLALAAKGKKQKSSIPIPISNEASPAPEDVKSESKEEVGSFNRSPNSVGHLKQEDNIENKKEIPNAASSEEFQDLQTELQCMKSNNSKLSDEIKQLKAQLDSNPVSGNKDVSQLNTKLAAKDETIDQLMKEGEALSLKELKLNESIKKLKASNNNLETSLGEYSKKNSQVLLKLNEQEDFLKKHKLKSFEQLIDSYSDISNKLAQKNDDLEKEKSHNWEGKFKEQQRLYESELNDRKQTLKRLNELTIQFDMSKKQNSLELDTKNTIIKDLKRDINNIKEENSQEIYRLENKVEALRVENENSVGDISNSNNRKNSQGNEVDDKFNSKQIEYDEFVKLSDNHHNLQQQYLSGQENWKLIESNLLNKVGNLTSSIESLKKTKSKLNNDLQKSQTSFQNLDYQYNELKDKFEKLSKEKEDAIFQCQMKDNDHQELQEKFDKFQQIYNTDRQNLSVKIKQLEETLEKSKSTNNANNTNMLDQITTPTRRSHDNDLHLNLEPPKLNARQNSSTNVTETSMYYNNSGWPEIKLGESSHTPAISREYSSMFMNPSRNNSSTSFVENGDTINDPRSDNYSFNSKFPNQMGNSGISGIIPTSGNNNIQLINKMSSNIRRLEIELHTLKDENNQLSLDKEQAQQEILNQFKRNDEIEILKEKLQSLRAEIEEKSTHEQTMLELIGEKSEQVEELKADVQDLKDLCKSQVQSMIELHESK